MLLRGSKVWAHICERILAACQKWTRPRLNAMSVLMSSGPPPKYHPQPVGQPRKGYKLNRTTGTWDRDFGDAVEDGGSRKRPVGAPPKGTKWDSTTGAWVVKPFAESKDTMGGALKVKKPRGPPRNSLAFPGNGTRIQENGSPVKRKKKPPPVPQHQMSRPVTLAERKRRRWNAWDVHLVARANSARFGRTFGLG